MKFPHSRATHLPTGRFMEVYSNQPGVQFYTSNFLPDESSGDKLIVGKNGAYYMKHGAFCLETQNFPDAVNHVSYTI
jgi:aldose 1-epimerase